MRILPIAVMGLCLASCVGTKEFTIRTKPEGARIYLNGELQQGKTPMTLTISQKKDLGIVASKPGYENAAYTVKTQQSWWLSLLWTKNDPRAQYIEENEVTIPMKRIPSAADYRPTSLPKYTGGGGLTTPQAPSLRPLPDNLMVH